jgi:hypothetical protein
MPLALKKEDPALQNIKFSYFFPIFVVTFALLDPDSHCQCGSGSSRPKSIRIHVDPNPDAKHCAQFKNNQ